MVLRRLLAGGSVTLLLAGCVTVNTQPTASFPLASPSPVSSVVLPTVLETATPAVSAPPASATGGPSMPTPTLSSVAPSEAPSQTPEITATPESPTPTSSAAGESSGLVVKWTDHSDTGFDVVYSFDGLAGTGGNFAAIGEATQDLVADVWHSTDGVHWSEADFADSGSESVLLYDLTAGDAGFVIVGGSFDTGGEAWFSADGASWQPADNSAFGDQTLNWVSYVAERYVAVSEDGHVFLSSDGLSWTEASDSSAADAVDNLEVLASNGASLWAVRDGGKGLEVWETSDGESWTKTAALPDSKGAYAQAIGIGPLGLVINADVYTHQTPSWQTWFSSDGVVWQPTNQSPRYLEAIVGDVDGFVGIGHYNSVPGCAIDEIDDVGVTWTSVDGMTWHEMPEKGWKSREIQQLTLSGRTLIGLGVDYKDFENSNASGHVWTFDLPGSAEETGPSPSPSPAPTANPGC